ncbi:YgjV family protein [Histidinibacterium aquaticum]|uniref:YgjV family protein n=1 Tax=Histidinibacterium aquaticum TaxID=2613962 RepID=A0A5J5GJ02_9RHOB|nr:YgjV family protein [Histidinibacterium aquaticum]KAA9008135.1 YgjV family protein [Histidinibacterium aquaticum]
MGDTLFWTGQAVGALAAMLGVLAFQMPRRTPMLATLGASALAWSLHFLLLAAPAAAGINLVTALRNFCGIRLRAPALALLFIAFYVAAAVIGWKNIWDLLPLAAVVLGTLSVFRLEGLAARSGFLAGSLLWVIYNTYVGSIAGVVVMLADAGSNARFILRAMASDRAPR